jgi:hypothetical protein
MYGIYRLDVWTYAGTETVELIAADEYDAFDEARRHYGEPVSFPVLIDETDEFSEAQ